MRKFRRVLYHQYRHSPFNGTHVVSIVERKVRRPTKLPQFFIIYESLHGIRRHPQSTESSLSLKNIQQFIRQGIEALDMSQENRSCLLR